MSYKTILVHTDRCSRCAVGLEVAIRIAKQHDAHLIALYTQEPFVLPGYLMQVGPEFGEAQEKAAVEEMGCSKAVYRNLLASMGFKNAEWRTTINFPLDALAGQARYADLVVVAQRDAAERADRNKDFPVQLVLTSGRPVLILPDTGGFLKIGRRILVAWNASREAMRAISDALPMLKLAETVRLLALSPKHGARSPIPVDDIVHYIARHGVQVEVSTDHVADIDIGAALLSRAADFNADLLVMGGYGHSRLREWVLGGATRTILDSMTVPVLMSH